MKNLPWLLPLLVLLPFGLYSDWLVYTEGYTGFITLAMHDKWALQMLLDVTISVGLFTIWMLRDARERGIPAWPYVIGCVTFGSIGALAYLVHRGVRGRAPALASESVSPTVAA
jgi:protein-S-isoprenylcysteine O-methyltransferase Ste14